MKIQNQSKRNSRSGRNFIGLVIILIGGLLLLDRLIPALHLNWLFSWPMILIVVGLFIGAQSKFENVASYILIAIGGFFLLNNFLNFNVGQLLWPFILIFLGFWMIKGKSGKTRGRATAPVNPEPDNFVWDKRVRDENEPTIDPTANPAPEASEKTDVPENEDYQKESWQSGHTEYEANAEDYIDSTSVFGDAKHYIISQQFMGGDVVNIMGGATINLMQADLKGPATLEVVQLFGGTTIIAPAHWVVKPEMASIFGGIEDKRFHTPSNPDRTKVLYIKGTSIFGGITIKSY